jgi:hypothetical protein
MNLAVAAYHDIGEIVGDEIALRRPRYQNSPGVYFFAWFGYFFAETPEGVENYGYKKYSW